MKLLKPLAGKALWIEGVAHQLPLRWAWHWRETPGRAFALAEVLRYHLRHRPPQTWN